jgi:hypothetical protein
MQGVVARVDLPVGQQHLGAGDHRVTPVRQRHHQFRHAVRVCAGIRVDEQQVLAGGDCGSAVARRGVSEILLQTDDLDSVPAVP